MAVLTRSAFCERAIDNAVRRLGCRQVVIYACGYDVAASQEEMESFLKDVIDQLPGIEKITTNVILSRIKDVKGLRL